MERLYKRILYAHIKDDRQMIFLAGPRQVGKTTTSKEAQAMTDHYVYLNWDFEDDQRLIMRGPQAIVDEHQLDHPEKRKAILTLDELHKYRKWRNYLKGFYDKYNDLIHFIVTGSSKLDVFRHSGDSLMGRYFPYRVHPLSVAELIRQSIPTTEINEPQKLDADTFQLLIEYGGFPEPLIKQSPAFYRRWVKLRHEQLFHLDIREITRIREIAQMKLLARMLKEHVCELANYTLYSSMIGVAVNTIKTWVETLNSFYYCFKIQPWSKNVARSLIKQPKIYLWNWADTIDKGARYENMVASHLLKAIHLWEDLGLGEYGLYFVRDKERREVDFLVTKNNEPWFLVECKSSGNQSISEHLYYYQKVTGAKHAFQLAFNQEYKDINCFDYTVPIIVPAITFLSQLV